MVEEGDKPPRFRKFMPFFPWWEVGGRTDENLGEGRPDSLVVGDARRRDANNSTSNSGVIVPNLGQCSCPNLGVIVPQISLDNCRITDLRSTLAASTALLRVGSMAAARPSADITFSEGAFFLIQDTG
jgi:hypothetical protein